jgi:mannitol-1-phosphate/altronate dehydrogenase
MADPQVARFVAALMREEVAPLLPPDVPGMELTPYQEVLLDRFASPAIADRLERLCRRGSTKMADYVLPSLQEAVAAGRPCTMLTMAVAGWFRYLAGSDLEGRPIDVQDPRLEELQPLAQKGVGALLEVTDLFGELRKDRRFTADVEEFLRLFEERGVRAALDRVTTAG